jgi:hypothetical protein
MNQAAFGFIDPIDFINALMGHRALPTWFDTAQCETFIDF